MKKLILLSVALIYLSARSQTFPIHVEAESYNTKSAGQVLLCAEGGNALGFMGDYDWVEYQVSLPKDSIYQLSVRVALTSTSGAASAIWITDSVFNVLGQIIIPPTNHSQDYITKSTLLFLKGGNRKIRLQMYSARCYINWLEITPTAGLTRVNHFDSDWDLYLENLETHVNLPWKACRADSATDWVKQTVRPQSLMLATDNVYRGFSSARFELTKIDSATGVKVRSEIKTGYHPSQIVYNGFATMSPTVTTGDSLPHVFYQWHGVGNLSPCISIRVEKTGKYVLKVLWSSVSNPTIHQGEDTYVLGDYVPNTWVRWKIYIKFAYDNTGELKVWKDDVEVATRMNAPNSYNDGQYPYLKIGIYKWGWDGWQSHSPYNKVVMYFDEFKMGDSNSSTTEIDPSN